MRKFNAPHPSILSISISDDSTCIFIISRRSLSLENKNAITSARNEPASNASNTLTPTFPQRIVTSRTFESSRRASTFFASLLFFEASSSRRSLLTLKNARFNPESVADCVIQITMPTHLSHIIMVSYFQRLLQTKYRPSTWKAYRTIFPNNSFVSSYPLSINSGICSRLIKLKDWIVQTNPVRVQWL